jgi:ATP synthase protein I
MSGPADDRGSGGGQKRPDEKAAFETRLSELESKLGKVRAQRGSAQASEADAKLRGRGMAEGMRMATEFVAAIIVGGLIGWALDRWFGTTPWLFLGFFLLGCVAGVLNLMRAYERMRKDMAAQTGGRIGSKLPDDEED